MDFPWNAPRRTPGRGCPGSLFLLLIVLGSCSRETILPVVRENLFILGIGRLEDQIDLFGLEGPRSARKTRITMRDGIFYVSNGNGGKLVRYTSYGDLLSMIYNPETNPPPLTLRTDTDSTEMVTRKAVAYPLNEPGELAVDSRKHIYLEDRLPQERRSFDSLGRSLLDSLVLHFDPDGRFLEYLGQEGLGGTPFPRISGIYPSIRDEIAVVCRQPSGWNVYWYDQDGNSLFLVRIGNADLPLAPGRESRPSLDSVIAAPDGRQLYLKIDYYRDTIDESTKTKSGIAFDGSIVWVMDVENGTYLGNIAVPVFEQTITENDKKISMDSIYSLIGAALDGRLFLAVPSDGGLSLLILEKDSQNQTRGFMAIDPDELKFNTFHLSADGILSGILASDWEARVVWWRTDRFIGDLRR